jgi:uncharacterized protein
MQTTALSVAGATVLACKKDSEPGGVMPMRVLGKTGLNVSILAFGGGSVFLKNKDGEWEALMKKAIDWGINLFDTSCTYQWGAAKSSEERFGEFLPAYRNKILISTKIETRDVAKGLEEFERSLKRMKTDYVDMLLIHSIEKTEDLAVLEKGLIKEMTRLKAAGQARFIGFSCMNSAEKSKEMLQAFDIDVCILAMNATQYGDFAKIAMPIAIEKNVGVIAMKLMKGIVGVSATASECLRYGWTQPGVATTVIAHQGIANLEENVRLAQAYGRKQISQLDRMELEQRLAHLAGPHALCWARADYYDGQMC